MIKTYAQRKHWIESDSPAVLSVIDCFPLLKKPKYVSVCVCLWFVITQHNCMPHNYSCGGTSL